MEIDKSKNLIVDLSFSFALKIINYTLLLEKNKRFVLASQLLRSGTSIGANVREAQNAESKSDFIHKIKIAAKEADETEYWLLLCQNSDDFPSCEHLIGECRSIIKILCRIIATSKSVNRKKLPVNEV